MRKRVKSCERSLRKQLKSIIVNGHRDSEAELTDISFVEPRTRIFSWKIPTYVYKLIAMISHGELNKPQCWSAICIFLSPMINLKVPMIHKNLFLSHRQRPRIYVLQNWVKDPISLHRDHVPRLCFSVVASVFFPTIAIHSNVNLPAQ